MEQPVKAEEQFLKAYDDFADAIFRHCFFRIFSRELAEELTQETFLKTWNYLAEGKEIENIRAFLYRVATNLIIDNSRKKKEFSLDAIRENTGFDPSDDSHRLIEKNAIFEEVMKGLKFLSEEDREIITLRYIDDFGPKEIAEILGLEENNVSVKLNRAVEKLKKVL